MMMKDWGNGVRTKVAASRFQVSAPYTKPFLDLAHAFNGRWRKRSRIWSFPRESYNSVALGLNRIYLTHLPTKEVPADEPIGH